MSPRNSDGDASNIHLEILQRVIDIYTSCHQVLPFYLLFVSTISLSGIIVFLFNYGDTLSSAAMLDVLIIANGLVGVN